MAERPGAMSVAELEVALADLGRHVAYPPTPALAARVRLEIAQRPAPRQVPWLPLAASHIRAMWQSVMPNQRRLALALVALIALAAAAVAVSPEARTAVAERLGLRSVLIREIPALPTPQPPATGAAASPSAGARLSLGQMLSLDEVRGRIAFSLPLPDALGPPDELYLQTSPPGGQVSLVYYPRAELPEARTTGLGLLLTAFQGSISPGMFQKGIPPGARIEELRVNGGRGYWIEGDPHTIYLMDSRGQIRSETTRLAGNVLLWDQGPLTLRIESTLPKDAALAIAASLR